MADAKDTAAELAALKKELAEKDAILAQAAENGGFVVVPVPGSYEATWKDDATGKTVKKKIQFQDGASKVRIADGRIVASQSLLLIANGKAPIPKHVQDYPALLDCNQEQAQALLVNLAKMGAAFLK